MLERVAEHPLWKNRDKKGQNEGIGLAVSQDEVPNDAIAKDPLLALAAACRSWKSRWPRRG